MYTESTNKGDVVVVGAGPAGLTAAYQLGKAGRHAVVFEADDVVGGISRTARAGDWRFDIGGHRFFTKVAPVRDLWHEILPDEDFLLRPRMSRIYYGGKFYDYPLRAFNALRNLGLNGDCPTVTMFDTCDYVVEHHGATLPLHQLVAAFPHHAGTMARVFELLDEAGDVFLVSAGEQRVDDRS